jgi:hypothetical protein
MRASLFSVCNAPLLVVVTYRGSRGVLAPFNSLVLETVTVSKAFAVASTAAMIAVDVLTHSDSECDFLYSDSRLGLSHRLRTEPERRRAKTSKFRVGGVQG